MENKNSNVPEPWERQPGESSKRYEAFCTYRNLGPNRSISKVVQELNKSRQLLGKWSSEDRWVDRCVAWDEEQDRIARQEQTEEIKKMRKRHAKIATDMLEKASAALNTLRPAEVKPADISRIVEVASKLERISRGDVETIVEERMGEPAASPVTFYLPDNGRDKDEEEEI